MSSYQRDIFIVKGIFHKESWEVSGYKHIYIDTYLCIYK